MAQINRYTQTQQPRYNARSLDELLTLPTHMRQEHDSLEGQIGKANQLLSQIDYEDAHAHHVDPERDRLNEALRMQRDNLQQTGFSPSSKSNFNDFATDYAQQTGPKGTIGQAQKIKASNAENKKAAYDAAVKDGLDPRASQANYEKEYSEYLANEKMGETMSGFNPSSAPKNQDFQDDVKTVNSLISKTVRETVGRDVPYRISRDPQTGEYVIFTEEGSYITESNSQQLADGMNYIRSKWIVEGGEGRMVDQWNGIDPNYRNAQIDMLLGSQTLDVMKDTRRVKADHTSARSRSGSKSNSSDTPGLFTDRIQTAGMANSAIDTFEKGSSHIRELSDSKYDRNISEDQKVRNRNKARAMEKSMNEITDDLNNDPTYIQYNELIDDLMPSQFKHDEVLYDMYKENQAKVSRNSKSSVQWEERNDGSGLHDLYETQYSKEAYINPQTNTLSYVNSSKNSKRIVSDYDNPLTDEDMVSLQEINKLKEERDNYSTNFQDEEFLNKGVDKMRILTPSTISHDKNIHAQLKTIVGGSQTELYELVMTDPTDREGKETVFNLDQEEREGWERQALNHLTSGDIQSYNISIAEGEVLIDIVFQPEIENFSIGNQRAEEGSIVKMSVPVTKIINEDGNADSLSFIINSIEDDGARRLAQKTLNEFVSARGLSGTTDPDELSTLDYNARNWVDGLDGYDLNGKHGTYGLDFITGKASGRTYYEPKIIEQDAKFNISGKNDITWGDVLESAYSEDQASKDLYHMLLNNYSRLYESDSHNNLYEELNIGNLRSMSESEREDVNEKLHSLPVRIPDTVDMHYIQRALKTSYFKQNK